MYDNIAELVFAASVLLNALLFIPQAIRLYNTKDARGVSIATFAGFNFIQAVTVVHGFITGDLVLAWGYLLSFVTCLSVTMLAIYYRKSVG